MWSLLAANLANIGIGALSAALTGTVAYLAPAGNRWLREKIDQTGVGRDAALADKMDQGAVSILMATSWALDPPDMATGRVPPAYVEALVERAHSRFSDNFRDTIAHFDMSPEAVRDYLRARVARAIA